LTMNCTDSRELLIEYSLGQLDPNTADQVRRHLAGGCTACATALAEIAETWASLAADLEPVKPSIEVEKKLLAMTRSAAAPPLKLALDRSIAKPVPPHSSRVLGYVLAASLVGISAAVIAWRFTPLGPMFALRETGPLSQETWGAPRQNQSDTGFQTVALEPVAESPGVRLWVVINQRMHEWHVLAAGLPLTVDGEINQIWLETRTGSFEKPATITVNKSGTAGVIIDLAQTNPAELAALWLTRETTADRVRPSENVLFHATIK
jgi:hypothetical protein